MLTNRKPSETNPRPETSLVSWHKQEDKNVETTIVYWGYIGIMENEMETTIVYCIDTHILNPKR